MSSDNDFIQNITTKFLRHIGSVERLMESYDFPQKEKPVSNNGVGHYVAYVANLKHRRHSAKIKEDWEVFEKTEEALRELENADIFKMVDKYTIIKETDDEFIISIESSLLVKAYRDYIDSTLDLAYDDTQFQNSLIISLVIGMEILIAEIFKDYVNNMDSSEQVLKDKTIGYNLLKDIGSVEEAKSFLIDQYIEKLLRDSFTAWLDEFKKVIKINLFNKTEVKESILLINETIQRRHLIIHNDGIVNDLYLNKIDPSLRTRVSKGERLTSEFDYIKERTSTFRTFGLILIYYYGAKKYRSNMDSLFIQLNGLLVLYLKEDPKSPRYIFKNLIDSGKLSKEYHGMSIINYFLTYSLNGDDSIKAKVEEFNAEEYGSSFLLAKKIILGDEKAEQEALEYLKTLDDDDFINTLTWPLFRLVKKTDVYRSYVEDRMKSITSHEMEDELIETE